MIRGVAVLVVLAAAVRGDEPGVVRGDEAAGRSELLAAERAVFQRALGVMAPCIVRIDTIGGAERVPAAGRGPERSVFQVADGPTTGVIWSSDGYIITSSINFVHDPAVITVRLADGRRLVGRLVARDRPSRLALVKVDAGGLPAPRLADAGAVRPGRWALAAGFGYGSASPVLSVGVVSAVRRMDGRAVQTDARTSPANYGGPLFDIEGRLLGICVPLAASGGETAGVEWYDSGIGFAIDAAFVQRRFMRLRHGEDLQRGLLGLFVDQRRRVVGVEDDDAPPVAGLRITEDPVGPAAEAGLAKGDVLTAVDGVACTDIVTFRRHLATRVAGDTVTIEFWRDGVQSAVQVGLVPASALAPPASQPGRKAK